MKKMILFKSLIIVSLCFSLILVSCDDEDDNDANETIYLYSNLRSDIKAVVDKWFADNPTIAPVPNANEKVELTEGNQSESSHNIGNYFYDVDFADYFNARWYDVEFFLNSNLSIIAVIVDTKYIYSTLPTSPKDIKAAVSLWFTNNPTIATAPSGITLVEITVGGLYYYYEIEIDYPTYDLKLCFDSNLNFITYKKDM